METLNMIFSLMIATIVSIFLYKYIVSRQRLAYDDKINIELIVTGVLLNLIFRILLLGIGLVIDRMNIDFINELWHLGLNVLYATLFIGITFAFLYQKIMKVQHYINRYDIAIYCLSMGIGFGVSNIVLLSIFEDSLSSMILIFSSILMPLSYMMIMATFFIRLAEGKKKALTLAYLLPTVIVFVDATFYLTGSLFGIFSRLMFQLMLYGIFSTLFLSAIRNNVQIDGIDLEAQLDRFENEKTLREKISYRFDIFMSHGKLAITGLILLAGFIVIVIVAIILLVETPEITDGSITKTLWLSFMRVLDPGNVATDPDFNNSKFVVITTVATFIGLALIATYIGMVSGDFSSRIEKLREGNSKVLEKNHILLIGFCEDTLSIIDNLLKFHSIKSRMDIVVVSGLGRKEVEDEIAAYGLDLNRNRVICRNGDLESRNTLVNMGITRASKVVIIGDKKEETTRIAMTVNSILKTDRHSGTDILMMADTEDDLHMIKSVFEDRMKIYSRQDLDFDPVIRAGMLKEYLKLYGLLMGVEGDLVISLMAIKKCLGKPFGAIINGFKYSTVIGVEEDGEILLNPDKNMIIQASHKLIILSSNNAAPDYIKADKKFNPEAVGNNIEVTYTKESVQNMLIIGNRSLESLTIPMGEKNPNIKQAFVEGGNPASILHEIDEVMKTHKADIIVLLGLVDLSDDENDALNLKILAYLDAKHNRQIENYVVAALLNSVQDIKFAYELDYIDMAIENDKCRRMALELLDENNMITEVEQTIFKAGDRIGAVLAADILGTEENSVADIYRKCLEENLILVGYIIREGGLLNAVVNPNKNDKVRFDDDDLILVIN